MTKLDDTIRKVANLRALAAHPATGLAEAAAARALAERLVAKHDIDEADLEPVTDEDRQGHNIFGTQLDDDYIRKSKKFDRLRKEAEDALHRLVAFIGSEEEGLWARRWALEGVEKQLKLALDQMRECHWCHTNGYTEAGRVQRRYMGEDQRGRNSYDWFHDECWVHWSEFAEEWKKKQEEAKSG